VTADEIARVDLRQDEGVVVARQRARDIAELLGFDRLDQTRIATAVSELARNAHRYAGSGQVRFVRRDRDLLIEVADEGPGIPNLDDVLGGRYESRTGMGRGLVGVRLLMDAFAIDTEPGRGTRVSVAKTLPAGVVAPAARGLRDELTRRGGRSPYEEVTRQNEELLQALGEVRARQQELVSLNRELGETNRGVVALYAELDDRAERLRNADDRKSRFLADMSHELRTPLNSIIALTELLLTGEPPVGGEQLTQVTLVRQMAAEQLRLVGDLLDIAKIEAGHLTLELADVSAAELFTILRGQLRPLVADGAVDLRFDCFPDIPPLHTDEGKVVQVLRNLVSNAVKFTPAGEVLVSAEPQGADVVFRVTDTGIGIAAEDLPRIFEEFVQVPGEHQRSGQGTGLGLPLARKLIGLLGGTIDVISAVGAGTTFTVRLPARASAEPSRPAIPDVTGAVLMVDDDETARYVVEAHLRGTGWRVVGVGSGTAALEAVATALPAAIILDLSMPDLDGMQVLRRLRDRPATAEVPVVVHSSRLLDARERATIAGLGARVLDKSTASRAELLKTLSVITGDADGR
jgi:signal transduction histidine kinase/CheY-like chemotaxis protein